MITNENVKSFLFSNHCIGFSLIGQLASVFVIYYGLEFNYGQNMALYHVGGIVRISDEPFKTVIGNYSKFSSTNTIRN